MKIQVTNDDIEGGTKCSGYSCPIALALTRELGGKRFDYVGSKGVGRGGEIIPLPPEAQNFIRAFDGREPVKPFEFELEI